MRIIFWVIGVCIVNGWLLYRRHLKQRKEKLKMSLLEFQTNIAAALCEVTAVTRKRGRPSTETVNSPTELPKNKKANCTPTPVADIRLDGYHHWPEMVDIKGYKRTVQSLQANYIYEM